MEFLIVILFYGAVGLAIRQAVVKNKQKTQSGSNTRPAAARTQPARRPAAAQAQRRTTFPSSAFPAQVQQPAAPMQEGMSAYQAEAHAPITVTRHTDDIFSGSMNAESGEGYDPCHEDELQPEVHPCELSPAAQPAPEQAQSGMQLNFSGNDLVRALVMNEVLTRPCDRVRR